MSILYFSTLRHVVVLILALLSLAAADVSTTIISVTSTTTVHVTATDYAGACENFVGACVVYGSYGNAPYTTTIYRNGPSATPSLTTSTQTLIATATASNSGACDNFSGACVVYATGSGGAAASSTVYHGGNNDHNGLGNDQGYIAQNSNEGDGFIGSASGLTSSRSGVMFGLVVALALLVMWI